MIQQINLFQIEENNGKQILFDPYVLSVVISLVLILIVSGYSLSSFDAVQIEQQQLHAQLQQVQAQLQKIQADNPNKQIDTVLNQELQQTQSYYHNLTKTLTMLADTESDRSRGFSRYFVALANYVDHRIWLTHILFNAKTDNIILEGATYKAEQIPLLLQGLQASTIFKGRHFAKLSIDKTEAHSDQIDFTVNSSLKSKEEGANVDKH